MTVVQSNIDAHATIEEQQRARAMRLRNAYLEVLRAFEEMHDLPRSVPTKAEQTNRDTTNRSGHHNR